MKKAEERGNRPKNKGAPIPKKGKSQTRTTVKAPSPNDQEDAVVFHPLDGGESIKRRLRKILAPHMGKLFGLCQVDDVDDAHGSKIGETSELFKQLQEEILDVYVLYLRPTMSTGPRHFNKVVLNELRESALALADAIKGAHPDVRRNLVHCKPRYREVIQPDPLEPRCPIDLAIDEVVEMLSDLSERFESAKKPRRGAPSKEGYVARATTLLKIWERWTGEPIRHNQEYELSNNLDRMFPTDASEFAATAMRALEPALTSDKDFRIEVVEINTALKKASAALKRRRH